MDTADARALDEELSIASASSLRARAILRRALASALLPEKILCCEQEGVLADVIELRPKLKEPSEGGV